MGVIWHREAAPTGSGGPSEASEQMDLVRTLTRARLRFFAVPNGGSRRGNEGARLRSGGVRRGVPDMVILTPPPGGTLGTVIELKRADGVLSDVSVYQREWLEDFATLGWGSMVAFGAEDARIKLRGMGYQL